MRSLLAWMLFSKFVKLLGHYIRYPADFVMLPISILFGYFHGAIKIYAVLTLNVVSSIFIFIYLFCLLSRVADSACCCDLRYFDLTEGCCRGLAARVL
jgi:hypothetical protein